MFVSDISGFLIRRQSQTGFFFIAKEEVVYVLLLNFEGNILFFFSNCAKMKHNLKYEVANSFSEFNVNYSITTNYSIIQLIFCKQVADLRLEIYDRSFHSREFSYYVVWAHASLGFKKGENLKVLTKNHSAIIEKKYVYLYTIHGLSFSKCFFTLQIRRINHAHYSQQFVGNRCLCRILLSRHKEPRWDCYYKRPTLSQTFNNSLTVKKLYKILLRCPYFWATTTFYLPYFQFKKCRGKRIYVDTFVTFCRHCHLYTYIQKWDVFFITQSERHFLVVFIVIWQKRIIVLLYVLIFSYDITT